MVTTVAQHPSMEELLLPVELSTAVRFAIARSSHHWMAGDESVVVPQAEPNFDPKNPRLRKLVEAILYSRRFVLSYFVVIAAVLLLFAGRHWYQKWRRRLSTSGPGLVARPGFQTPASSALSSSSTSRGTDSPPGTAAATLDPTQDTPLLQKGHVGPIQRPPQSYFLRRLGSYIQAWLMYQPVPIPALTATKSTLPPNETSLLVVLLLGVNVFYLFYRTPISLPMLFALADRAGLCFVMNIPLLYVFAAKSNQPLKFLTGWSYEGLNIFHRRLGEWMTVLATIHTVGMFGVWYTLLRPANFTLLAFLSSRLVLLGIFAFVSYLAIYLTSTGIFRHWYYEVFLGLHITLQVVALVLVFFHHRNARPHVIAAFAIWTLDRVLIRFSISTISLTADLQIAEDGQTVLVFCQIPITPAIARYLDIRHGWQPGQHIFLTIPSLGWYHRLQAHPFSIASPAPPQGFEKGNWPLQLIIRAKDGFSQDLLSYTKFHQHTKVLLDGPYGSSEAVGGLQAADRTCLIAGGSGIAVTYPLAWHLQKQSLSQDDMISTRTVYQSGRKHVPNIVRKRTLPSDRYAHFWIRSISVHDTWLTLLPSAKASLSLDPSKSQSPIRDESPVMVEELVTEAITTQSETVSATDTDAGQGRPDVSFLLRNWVNTSQDDLHSPPARDGSVSVVVSGPDGLVRDVQNTAAELAKEGWNIEVQVEKFGW